MRSLPQRGSYVPTPAQLDQRMRFALVAHFLYWLKPIVGKYFGKKQGDKSVYNLATGYHLKEAITVVNNTYEMDYEKVLISKGELRGLVDVTATAAADQVIQLAWTDNSGQGYASEEDQLWVATYAPDTDLYQLFEDAAKRNDRGADLQMPAYFSGQVVHVWATFIASNGKDAATSSYLGVVTVS
ncbi:DUF6266 family protein [Subsaxibacter sp. CAU 1640]|nr:DUF6266 family protein [Subsaxibacter sp. CAU 1640]